ncbi:hypothetical protein BB558_005862 [Smittium angustum]|uniref:DUF726-domain-containing protein n=1 Tax=Smittium angustum TaxID=133377 RepID=A0A2U1IZ84_SMIAN|nr:hypothetical protein BB558_005862 [Smittium angustum]
MTDYKKSMKENPGLFQKHPARQPNEISLSVIIPDAPDPLGQRPTLAKQGKVKQHDYINDSVLSENPINNPNSKKTNFKNAAPVSESSRRYISTNGKLSPSILPLFNDPSKNNSRFSLTDFDKTKINNFANDFTFDPNDHQDFRNSFAFNRNSSLNNRLKSDFKSTEVLSANDNISVASHSTNTSLNRNSVSFRNNSEANLSPSIRTNSSTDLKTEKAQRTYEMMKTEDERILKARRQETLSLSKSILTDKQKIAYVGLVYLILIEMQGRLGVQYKEAVSKQKMIEKLTRHKIQPSSMARFLRNEGETIVVKTNNQVAISHIEKTNKPTTQTDTSPRKSKSFTKEENIYNKQKRNSGRIDPNLNENLDQKNALESENSQIDNDIDNIINDQGFEDQQPKLKNEEDSEEPYTEIDLTQETDINGNLDMDIKTGNTKSIAEELNEEKFTVIPAQQLIDVDIRATLILDLFLLMLSDEVFDSRCRYLLRRIAEALEYPWRDVQLSERRVVKQLSLFDYATEVEKETESNKTSQGKNQGSGSLVKRIALVGLATVGGGLVIGLSAGLLAPAIGAGLGATLSAIGIANAGTFFGSLGGTVLITTGGVLTGSGMAGVKTARRTRNISDIQLVPHVDDKSTNLIFTVPGWMYKSNNSILPFSLLDPINGDVFSLVWDLEGLENVGASFKMLATELATTSVMQTLQFTVLPNLLGPLSIPMWLTKLGYILDNPWSTGSDLARKAAPLFADAIFHRVQGSRPVTLIGFSLGALLIFRSLLELAKMDAFGIIEDVVLLGAPITPSPEEWRMASSVVGGRIINGYSRNDWVLKFLHRTGNMGLSSIAGLQPVENVCSVENFDFSDEISSHGNYYKKVPTLLQKLGFDVTRLDLGEDAEENGEVNPSDNIDNENAKLGSTEIERDMAINRILDQTKDIDTCGKSEPSGNFLAKFFKRSNSNTTKQVEASSEPNTSQNTKPEISKDDGKKFGAHNITNELEELEKLSKEFAEFGLSVKQLDSTLSTLVINTQKQNKLENKPDAE